MFESINYNVSSYDGKIYADKSVKQRNMFWVHIYMYSNEINIMSQFTD